MEDDRAPILISQLDPATFASLANCLGRNEGWKRLAETTGIFGREKIAELSAGDKPAERLLDELVAAMCAVDSFKAALRRCHLYDALATIGAQEKLQVVKQPTNSINGLDILKVSIGETLELEFDVSGIPPPVFTWFKGNEVVNGQNTSKLHLEKFIPSMEGEYYCSASQYLNDELLDQLSSDVIAVTTRASKCKVKEKPEEFVTVVEGSDILLKLKVLAYPTPSYCWMHNNAILKNKNKEVLHIPKCKKEHAGEYRCYVSNAASEEIIKVTVVVQPENAIPVFRKAVSKKIALLMGNDKYCNFERLVGPLNDTTELSNILKGFGFTTLNFCNLNLNEMKRAVYILASMISKGAYVFFYYAGHGFEHGDKYLLPTDCPDIKSYTKKDAIAETFILKQVLDKEPTLLVLILDMCLKPPERQENEDIFKETIDILPFKTNRNLIQVYSTASHLAAYENKSNCSGVYMNILKKYLTKSLPILTILNKVSAEMRETCPQQIPQISYTIAEDFYLNNPTTGFHESTGIYKHLDIQPQTTVCFNSTVTLRKFKGVFHNAVEVSIEKADAIDHKCNWQSRVEKPSDCETVLIIEDVQRLPEELRVVLKIDDVPNFEIKQSFSKLRDLFADIDS